jgi:arylsulfatase A-like enzyme
MGRLDLPMDQVFDVRVTDKTVERIEQAGDKPFLVTCSYNYPHDPNVVPSPYYESIDPATVTLPGNVKIRERRFEKDWSRQVVAELGEPGLREFLRIYYASVKLIDDQLGRVLEALDRAGKADNTIVVFTADHGDMAGGHGMVWKSTGSFYEEVVRVPLIISWPGRIRSRRLQLAANVTDLMPTLLGLLGRDIPKHVQGNNLAPYLLGQRAAEDGPAYSFCERIGGNKERQRHVPPGTRGQFMCRGKGWKYVCYSDGSEYLYHLAEDPGETKNLAGAPEYREKKLALREELTAWLRRTQSPARL